MSKLFVISFFVLTGCSHQATVGVSAPPTLPPTVATNLNPDNFDKAGVMLADGSRWVYNTSVQAWETVNTEENRAAANRYWVKVKDYSNKVVEKLKE